MIHVVADLSTCLKRVRNRDDAQHIAISDDQVEAYNRVAATIKYDWILEIQNDPPASEHEILSAINKINK
jgi:hypothetical protein